MNARLCPEEVNVASDTSGELWHKRLCHMSVKGMKRPADDNLIPVKNVHLERCTDCLAGKQNLLPIKDTDETKCTTGVGAYRCVSSGHEVTCRSVVLYDVHR